MIFTEREQSIWLAGLLDGEGCFILIRNPKPSRPVIRVTLEMADKDTIERAISFAPTGGKIAHKPKREDKKWNETYRVHWCGIHAEAVMLRVLPFMGERRTAKIKECLAQDLSHHSKEKQ